MSGSASLAGRRTSPVGRGGPSPGGQWLRLGVPRWGRGDPSHLTCPTRSINWLPPPGWKTASKAKE